MPLDPEAQNLMLELARPINSPRREDFLRAVAERLEASRIAGPGEAWRAGSELQRQYFDPPNLHCGQTGRRV
jgi:hypothetical protein